MRSGGMLRPPRATTRSRSATSAGLVFASGSKWLNIGSITTGSRKMPKTSIGRESSQQEHHDTPDGVDKVQAYVDAIESDGVGEFVWRQHICWPGCGRAGVAHLSACIGCRALLLRLKCGKRRRGKGE